MRTGIDYLHLVEEQHTAELAERVHYAQLPYEPNPTEPSRCPTGHVAGQLPRPDTGPRRRWSPTDSLAADARADGEVSG